MAEAKKEGYTISDIYQGGYSAFAAPSNSYATAGSFGMTTDPRSANILKEVSSKLSMGVKQIEIEGVDAGVFDSIPKQQLKEVNRLSKLTGIDVSLHGPVMDVAGFSQSGFSETDRENAERKIIQTLLRSHELNPDGNIPVNFHSAEGIPGSQFLPQAEREKAESDFKRLVAVNKETGRLIPLEHEIEYHPGEKGVETEKVTPENRLNRLNKTEWDNSISQLIFNKERADEILEKNRIQIQHIVEDLRSGNIQEGDLFSPEQAKAWRHVRDAEAYLGDIHKQLNSLFNKAYEFGDEHQKKLLNKFSENFGKVIKENSQDPFSHAKAMHDLLHNLRAPGVAPKIYTKIEDFAAEKGAATFGNAAFEAYKKYKDKSPTLVIENPPSGFALSTGEDIANIVKKSREQFVKKAVDSGMNEREAKRNAEKFIGATWDVGHINMLRKSGFTEKEIIKESEKVAPFIKHVHLSDNFGFEHTELPMGMGNVPLKEIMEKLGEKGFEARKIIEAGHWWQHFQTPPFQEVLEATGTPLYSMKMAPNWGQAPGLYQGYFSGYGQMLPQINYETFGAGFSRLPAELGGSVQGAQGNRMSGRPME